VLDEGLAADVEAEHGSFPALDRASAEARVAAYEQRHRERMREYEAEVREGQGHSGQSALIGLVARR
jgi:hypothetical protein